MNRHFARVVLSLVVLSATSWAFIAASASAAIPNFRWREAGATIEANKGFEALLQSETFNIHFLSGGNAAEVKCSTFELSNGFLFKGSTRLGFTVGRDKGEFKLTKCVTTGVGAGCAAKEPITMLPGGSAESVLVADAIEKSKVEKLYDDVLPNVNKEFMVITFEGGACTPSRTFTFSTTSAIGGFGQRKEGEGGIVAEVDKTRTEWEAEKLTHQLRFICNGREQLPAKAFQGEAEEILIDKEETGGGNRACMEVDLTIILKNSATFSAF